MYNIKILIESKTIARLYVSCVCMCKRTHTAEVPTFVVFTTMLLFSLIQSSSDFLILSEQD